MSTCKYCTYRAPAMSYPLLYCQLRGLMVSPDFTCDRFVGNA